jgi:hypothetical protein
MDEDGAANGMADEDRALFQVIESVQERGLPS